MKLSFNNKKAKQRVISFVIAVAIITNLIPFGDLSEIITSSFSISASATDYTPNKTADDFPIGNYNFQHMSDFVDYCYYYNHTEGFAQNHQNDTLDLPFTQDDSGSRGIIPDTYEGLGTSEYPFNGTLRFSGATFTLQAHRALFRYVYDSVKLLNYVVTEIESPVVLNLVRLSDVGDDESKPLFADYVVHNTENKNSAEWKITLDSSSNNTYSGVIGEIRENAEVNLSFTNNSNAGVVSNSTTDNVDVGVICEVTKSGSTINLDYSGSAKTYSVTSAKGNAGGLVGTMENGSTLNINSFPNTVLPSVVSNNDYAGGLVGELSSDSKVNNQSGSKISVGGSVTGTIGAGGLFGHYTNYITNEFDISYYDISATVYGQYCGGVFGVLENQIKSGTNTSNELTIKNTGNQGTISITSGIATTYAYDGYFGGIIGKYTTDNLRNSLILDTLTITSVSQASFNAFGGAIGIVDLAAYIKADSVTVNATGTAKRTSLKKGTCENYAYFGGLIGATSTTDGVFVDVGDFILTTTENFCGGGIVGRFNNGVLRLSGTTDMKSAKPEGVYGTTNEISLRYSNYGQLVGYNDNVLVYALGDGSDESPSYNRGWQYKRSSEAISDDLGTWGEVVRVFNVEGTNKNAEQAGIVTLDSTEHTVTLEKAETSIGSTVDFAKTALNIMLNKTDVTDYDCLKFTSESGSTRDDLLSTTLMLTDNIDLSKTGINGFMRDGDFDITINTTNNVVTSNINSSNIGDVGTFTGTLNGSDKIVTLAIGESYGVYTEGQTEGTGQIYRHCYNGLFSVIGNGNDSTVTVNNLTVDGNVNIRNAGAYGMNVGGIAARSHGSTTLNHITVKQTVDYYEQRKFINSSNQDPTTVDTGNSIGGLIAYVDNNSNNSDNGTIAVKGNTEINPTFKFSGSHNNWMMYGGAIGNVVSSKVTINFAQDDSDKCTVSMKANTNGEANDFKVAKYASGGLIGHINTNGTYKDKKVNINNLDFNSCTVADPAQNTGGGFLGYSWHNTYVTIDGLTVTNGTLDCLNSAANVGVMCYRATGVWKVNSLAINGLTMSKGGDASLGMLVNKAYNKVLNANTKTYVTSGLYLNVLNSGYKLTDSGIKLPDSLETFDEIAAYSVDPTDPNSTNELTTKNVLIGNAGVISINMNTEKDGTETKITTTGTYQNQLTSVSSTANNNTKYANPYSRYYYNLDVMDSIYDSQNLLLWSVKKYAATNIQGEFVTTLTDDNLNGSADLTGLSFYPLANADSCTLKNLNIKFDYSVLYNNAETTNNNDGYTRDPGKSNQHYLMHSGLFLNVPTGKTVTISGDLSLSGTFLEIDGYSGVLVSQTVNGNIKSASGSKIKLDGIKPKTKDNAEYQDGYLLINNIERESDLTAAPNIYIEGVYTTNNYSADGTTSQVAKSLIGAATGKGLNIVFSKIKLDSRDGNSTDESLNAKAEELYNAYCTYNSIFTNSTLLASIKTDQNATLEYNYTYDEDWGTGNRHVTYGKEVTDSKEYVGEENRYYGDPRNFTNPVFSDNTEFYFSSGFLEYVDEVYTGNKDSNGLYYRELKVNVMTVALDEGCGTYNDPYVITGEKQLEAVAKFIGSGLTSDLSQLNLPKEQLDGITVNAKGDRWCNDKNGTEYHDVFKPSTSDSTKYVTADNANTWSATNVQYYLANAYYKIDSDIELSENFLGLGGNSENTAFRGVIVGNNNTITNKSDKPFINVSNGSVIKDLNIVVANEAITLNQTSYGSQEAYFYYDSKCKYYGGIIGEIMGGDNIIDNSYVSYQSTITLSGTYGMLCPVGSYVGVVVFGGLIFKNINATTANDNARSGNEDQENYPDNFVVNYVASNTIPTGDEKNLALSDSKGAIYVNPLVGRVINGYAVNETDRFSVTENNEYHYDDSTTDDRRRNGTLHSLKNNTKHYTIADINPNLDKLNVTKVPKGTDADGSKDGNINIPNAQAFFILSLITQSCSGTATTAGGEYVNSLSYGTNNTVYGMSHIADYNAVGTTETDSTKVADYNNLASKDTAAKTAVPYIIARYTKSVNKSDTDTTQVYPARCVTSTKGYYDIDLTENVDYVLPDSFRGIGSVGRMNDTANDANASESKKIEVLYYTFKLDTFDGKGCTIDIDMYINRYWKRIDNYFDYLHNGTIQKGNNSLLEFDNLAKYKVNGFGLFDTVVMRNEASAIKAFTLSGSVNVESYKYDTQKPNPTGEEDKARHDDTFTNVMWLSVGGVCGWSRNDHYVMFEKINLNDLSVRGPCKVAGLLGESGISSKYINVSVKECGADNLSLELTNGGAKGNNGREAYRNSIGAFVGKVAEGKVIVDGGNNGKTVTLNKFSILSTGGAGYSAGGLVAYAGNGCEVTNMTVSPVDSSKPITIGRDDAGTGMAGGIVGLMQPYTQDVKTNNCFAVFEGCKVENLNIKGNYAGGFYGGTWDDGWVPVNITINNCEVVGKLNSENKINNDIYGKTYAGGIVACGRVSKDGNPNIQISNTKVANYNITAKGSNYVGGMIGYCDSHQSNSSVVCYMYNSSIENCILGTGTNYSGGVMGKINKKVANKILGYNVKLDKVTSESSYMGAWVGYMASSDTTTSIQFTGMAIYGDGFSKNVGNDDANLNNTRFVFADYNGACNNADSGGNQKNISGFNYDDTGTHVTMPKYPYVNISPQSKMGTLTETTSEYISGDGAVLYSEPVTEYSEKTAEKTMAAKIYADTLLTDSTDKNYSRRYTTFSDTEIYDGKKIDYYLKRTVDEDSDRISTYATERGSVPEGVDDFAVVVIANKNDTETTNLINRYIQLVTNTTTDYTESSEYYNIAVSTCKYSNGKFAIDSSLTPGLKWKNGTFALNGENADSKTTNTFTLVDVQFKDPLHTDTIAYHLYVPVYTIKQMEVGFYTSVKTGTKSVSYKTDGTVYSDYSDLTDSGKRAHIDSLETWITQYVRFTYNVDDINILLNKGNVKWNHNKYLNFDTQSAGGDTEVRLPESTFMVLVDPNGNSDKEYYANVSDFDGYINSKGKESWTIDFTKFKRGENSYFKEQTLNDIIARNINVTENTTGQGLYTDGTAEDYNVYRIDENGIIYYYKYSADGNGNYDLSVNEDVNEDYYISMYVPKEESYNNELYYYSIFAPDELTGIKSAKVNQNNTYSVLVADLYTQNTTNRMTVSPDDQQISASNKTITVKASTSISINNSWATLHLGGTTLYHSFNLSLNRYTESGVTSEIIGLKPDSITATYNIGAEADENSTVVNNKDLQSNYLNIETTEIMQQLIKAFENNSPLEIYAYIEMDFDENQLENEFPQKNSESNIGVNVAATSNLAYDSERLAYTSMSKAFDADNHYYYRESVNSAILYYSAVNELDEYETYGKDSQNQSRLGINGYCYDESTLMPINTQAKYNVSAISSEDLKLAKSLQLTITLSKKTDRKAADGKILSVEYVPIENLLSYLDKDMTITSGTKYSRTHSITQSADSLTVNIPIGSCDVESDIYNIGIGFKAKTGVGFTEYANYRITLRAELLKENGTAIENSSISDYIVYTNAKVYPTVFTNN